jgi:hypothetical protein
MLLSVDSQSYIDGDYIPHKSEYNIWINRLSKDEITSIHNKLNEMVDEDEIKTSSWMPGSNWSSTVFHPIYEKACRCNEESAAKCFGLMLWHVLLERDDVWGFGRYEKDGIPIQGMTYFRIHNPPSRQ